MNWWSNSFNLFISSHSSEILDVRHLAEKNRRERSHEYPKSLKIFYQHIFIIHRLRPSHTRGKFKFAKSNSPQINEEFRLFWYILITSKRLTDVLLCYITKTWRNNDTRWTLLQYLLGYIPTPRDKWKTRYCKTCLLFVIWIQCYEICVCVIVVFVQLL